jgi:outer membrane protein insertion porin family
VIAALLLCSSQPGIAQEPTGTVQKILITHVGPQSVNDDYILSNIRIKPGDAYLRTAVNDSIKNLYSTGYFYNIRVGEEEQGVGDVALTFYVQAKPTITDIQFIGNEHYTRRTLLKKLSSKVGQPLDEHKLFKDKQDILKKYQRNGRQKTTVEYTTNVDEKAGRASVVFEIVEAPKIKIKDVVFENAEVFKQRKLRKTVKTRRFWFLSFVTGSGTLKDDQVVEDREKLIDLYHNAGYLDFKINDITSETVSDKRMVVHFDLDEGKMYRVGQVSFEGNTLFSSDEILRGVYTEGALKRPTMLSGEVFSPKGLSADVDAIQDFYGSRGYIDASIVAVKIPNVENSTMDVVYRIDEFSKSYVEKIEIRGNTKTKDKVIRRELAITPGETFDMTRVNLSKKRLEGLQYFSKVDPQPEPTDIPDQKNLILNIEEQDTANFMIGAGFSTVDNLFGYAEVSQSNFDLFKPPYFMGGGQKMRLRATLGTERQDYILSFVEPWLFGRKLTLSTDFYWRQISYYSDEFEEEILGGKVGLTRTLWNDYWIGGLAYSLENVDIKDVTDKAPYVIRQDQGANLISKIMPSIAYDTRNSTMLPNKGQRSEFMPQIAGGPLGGDFSFYKLELRTAWYFKGFGEGDVLEVLGRVGTMDTYNDSNHVPFYEKYYLGGAYDMRGYKYRHLGPLIDGEPVGGQTYAFGSLEYSVPIVEEYLRVAAFYDIGWVNPDAYDFDPSHREDPVYGKLGWADNIGLGVRLNIPMLGPLRFDYGVPINGKNESGSGRFNFSVGYTREF